MKNNWLIPIFFTSIFEFEVDPYMEWLFSVFFYSVTLNPPFKKTHHLNYQAHLCSITYMTLKSLNNNNNNRKKNIIEQMYFHDGESNGGSTYDPNWHRRPPPFDR